MLGGTREGGEHRNARGCALARIRPGDVDGGSWSARPPDRHLTVSYLAQASLGDLEACDDRVQ